MVPTHRSDPGPGGPPSWPALDALGRLREELLARVAALEEPDRTTWQAPGGGWTPVQVLQHLLRVEEVLLEQMDRRGPSSTQRTFRHRVGAALVGAIFLFGIRVRMPTRKVDPGSPIPLREVRSRWLGARRAEEGTAVDPGVRAPSDPGVPGPTGTVGVAPALHQRLRAAEVRDPAAPVMVHPVSGPLTPRGATDFLLGHMRHHERQLNRILHANHRR